MLKTVLKTLQSDTPDSKELKKIMAAASEIYHHADHAIKEKIEIR